jgi:hypothetical protein
MNEKNVVNDQIRKKELEIRALEEKLRSAKIYVQALKDVLSVMSAGEATGISNSDSEGANLRQGSTLAFAKETILATGRPMHVDELLLAAKKQPTREARVSLSSALSSYVRRGEIFTRPSKSTFGLIELQHFSDGGTTFRAEPPPGFGRVGNGLVD